MHSEEFDIEESSYIETKEQFTQVNSEVIVKKDSPILKDAYVGEPVQDVVTVFEHCQIIQDTDNPTFLTIVKEKLTEETVNHPSDLPGESNSANRYKYIREVIKPFLRTIPRGNPVSSEAFVKEAIESARRDFPDCHPSLPNSKYIKTLQNSSVLNKLGKVDALTSSTNMEDKKSKDCVPKCDTDDLEYEDPCASEEQSASPKPSAPKQKPPCGPPVHRPPKCEKKKECVPKIKKVCSKDSAKCEKSPEVIVVNETKSDSIKFNTDGYSPSSSESEPDEDVTPIVEGQKETISAKKGAMEDLIETIYKTTQDAMTTLTSESKKALEVVKISEAANTITQIRDNVNHLSESVGLFLVDNKNGPENESEEPCYNNGTNNNMIGSILTKVDSALSMLGNQISKSFENFNSDRSSPYDQPRASNKVSHVFTPNTGSESNSVFSIIKSKIISMFSETDANALVEEPPLTTPLSIQDQQCNHEDGDEDFIEKFIE